MVSDAGRFLGDDGQDDAQLPETPFTHQAGGIASVVT